MEIDQKRIEDAIVDDVSRRLVGDDDLYSRVSTAVETRINKLFAEKADAQIASAIDAAISNGFDREYQLVTAWGAREGEKTTIRAELEKTISGYWNTTVDSNGKPSDSYGNKTTRAEWVMMKIVADDFKGDMKQHVVNLGGALKDGLRSQLHETVNTLLSDVFKVNSADDQAQNRRGQNTIQPPVKPAES